ncbi:MAG: RluA family pseudouridine synthase [Planctomycetota bacterium]|nr:RluA family pseudouridine synthase [Planctomycetota bacterium]MDA1106420.1 RluA family pseudouridine synthase [Planctomycetota bacterium]
MSVGAEGLNRVPAGDAGWVALHVDQWVVVLDKSSGLLSVPGIGPEKADCLASRVAAQIPGARIVHRLDRDTSGVIVMARDAESHRSLSMAFERREVRKEYTAIVAGIPQARSGTIDAPIRKDLEHPPRQLIDHVHGRPSVTHWELVDGCPERDASCVRLVPQTGRGHQLRLHLLSIGHPILGDDLYAPPERIGQSPRLCLHAAVLEFTHPGTGERVSFPAPAPFALRDIAPLRRAAGDADSAPHAG